MTSSFSTNKEQLEKALSAVINTEVFDCPPDFIPLKNGSFFQKLDTLFSDGHITNLEFQQVHFTGQVLMKSNLNGFVSEVKEIIKGQRQELGISDYDLHVYETSLALFKEQFIEKVLNVQLLEMVASFLDVPVVVCAMSQVCDRGHVRILSVPLLAAGETEKQLSIEKKEIADLYSKFYFLQFFRWAKTSAAREQIAFLVTEKAEVVV